MGDVNGDHGHLLRDASYSGNLALVQQLLEQGANVNVKAKTGWTPLHCASSQGHLKIAQLLVKHGANYNATDNGFGSSPLHAACSFGGRRNIVKWLVEIVGANVNLVDNQGQTPLHCASKCENVEIVKLLIQNGASGFNIKDCKGQTPLQEACNSYKHETVKLLLMHTDLNDEVQTETGTVPLYIWTFDWACQIGHIEQWLEIAKILIQNTTSDRLDAKYYNGGKTPLHIACEHERLEIVKLLAENGVNLDAQNNDGKTALRQHCEYVGRSLGITKYLIECGANVHDKSNDGWTLRWACEQGHLDIAKLLAINDNLNVQYENGKTPLHWTVHKGFSSSEFVAYPDLLSEQSERLKVANFLIENGSNVNATNNDGKISLHLACENRCWEIAKLLIESGSSINGVENEGKTPLRFACEVAHLENNHVRRELCDEVVKLLIDSGADLNVECKDGMTPLHFVCQNGNLDMVKLFVSRGANISTKTSLGCTPLHLACQENRLEVVWFLLRQFPWLVSE